MSDYDVIGLVVGGITAHLECAPDGPTRPIFAVEECGQNCDICGHALLDIPPDLVEAVQEFTDALAGDIWLQQQWREHEKAL